MALKQCLLPGMIVSPQFPCILLPRGVADLNNSGTQHQRLAHRGCAQVSQVMDQFEKQFENLDVQSEFVEQAMSNQANLSTPEDQVTMLMQQVADEHNLEVALEMPGAGTSTPAQQQVVTEDGDLGKRLAELRK
mmetsp:Transcript_29829/g.84073  ORF Transcript_29829/g.84073 Transcript_29829/m.84073 type:complete len:134 (+) Transcript_29829:889-1290(+)